MVGKPGTSDFLLVRPRNRIQNASMKALAFFFVIALGFVISSPGQLTRVGGGGGESIPTVRYPMKGVNPDSAKFNAIFADVSLVAANQRSSETFLTIIQTLSPGFFLAETGGKIISVELPGRSLADQTEITLQIENSGRLHKYTNTLGALSTVAVYKITNPQEKFTRARFLASLQGGKTYTIRRISGSEKKDLLVVWE
jgi:hypothetical protein